MTNALANIPATLAALQVGPIQFDTPIWLALIPLLWAAAAWMGRRSLAGLGSVTRWIALAVRFIVIALLAGAAAEPEWRNEAKDVSVTVILDSSQSVPLQSQQTVEQYVEAAKAGNKNKNDRLGVVTVGKDAFVQALPTPSVSKVVREHVGVLDATNLASGVRLAMSLAPPDAANRLLIASDGQENVGSVLAAAEAAKAAGIPIDVLLYKYKIEGEVMIDRLIAPATARMGENIPLRVVLSATKPARGWLNITLNGEPIDLDPGSPKLGVPVELRAGVPNVFTVPVPARNAEAHEFKATFEPEVVGGRMIGDAIAENNSQMGVTFVSGEGRVLVVSDSPTESEQVVAALTQSKIASRRISPEQFPGSLREIASYDAVVMLNQASYAYSQAQQEAMRQYVHDSGGGLVMVGGPNAFGAGGWIGSPVEDALPVKLDPPQKRQMPRGALALVIHSVEIPEGVYLGKKVCEAAVNALSRLDYIGILESPGLPTWTHPMQVVGDGTGVKRSIQNMNFGDMPDFAPSLEMTLKGLLSVDAGQRHAIIISDGDPQPPSNALLQKFVDARIAISTIGVACHGASDQNTLKSIAEKTNGKFYNIAHDQLATLPQIFIKEAQTVKRSLIWEGPPFSPTITGVAETIRGIAGVPPLKGYVVTADREGLALVTMRGKENDPIAAQWQYGLGRTVAFMSDATTRWTPEWVAWSGFRAFWEQHVRWAMRPSGNANVRIVTQAEGDETIVTAYATDASNERLNFANFQARLAQPDGTAKDVEFRQVGPGRYEARVRTDQSGFYVLSANYRAPGAAEGQTIQGSIQAAITKPFADEYRTLEDNEPLMRQVATLTGGRVIEGNDPVRDDLWSRQGVTMPVALRPIWLALALTAIGLFVMDVGVRRVRIDPALIASMIRKAFRASEKVAGEQVDALKAARKQAQVKIAKRASGGDEVKSVKFEASKEQMSKPSTILSDAPAPIVTKAEKPAGAKDTPANKQDGEGMSRLLKAKKRAQEDMKED